MSILVKPLCWVSSAKKRSVCHARCGAGYFWICTSFGSGRSDASEVKVLRGFIGAGVLEVVDDYLGDTYRAVYTLRLPGAVYVLHCFQKKSKRGVQTPRQDIELVRERLKAAFDHAQREKENRS